MRDYFRSFTILLITLGLFLFLSNYKVIYSKKVKEMILKIDTLNLEIDLLRAKIEELRLKMGRGEIHEEEYFNKLEIGAGN